MLFVTCDVVSVISDIGNLTIFLSCGGGRRGMEEVISKNGIEKRIAMEILTVLYD